MRTTIHDFAEKMEEDLGSRAFAISALTLMTVSVVVVAVSGVALFFMLFFMLFPWSLGIVLGTAAIAWFWNKVLR